MGPGGAAAGAGAGGGSRYSDESFEDQSGEGFQCEQQLSMGQLVLRGSKCLKLKKKKVLFLELDYEFLF